MNPVTDIAQSLNNELSHLVQQYESRPDRTTPWSGLDGGEDGISKHLNAFFKYLEEIPEQVNASEHRVTIYFEIDASLTGLYGRNRLLKQDSRNGVSRLLKDVTALWQRYYLVGFILRTNETDYDYTSVMTFYLRWKEAENVGIQQSEYDRIIEDIGLVLWSGSALDDVTRIQIFTMLGNIIITLGVDAEYAMEKLRHHREEIRRRRPDIDVNVLGEILLCLFIVARLHKAMPDDPDDHGAFERAIRHWAARFDFLEKLFKSWGWYWENDYVSQLTIGDQLTAQQRSPLYLSATENRNNLSIGRSFDEASSVDGQGDDVTLGAKTIPVFVFGEASVGKTSFLNAFTFEAQMGLGTPVTMGKELQALNERMNIPWRNCAIPPTTDAEGFYFWKDLNLTSFQVIDYGGRDTRPDQWEPALHAAFRSAKALLFFLDDSMYTNEEVLRKKSNWFDALLQYWLQSNPSMKNIPIALVLTKYDRILDAISAPEMISMAIGKDFLPVSVELQYEHRFSHFDDTMKTPYGRLKDYFLHRRDINKNPVLQDTVYLLVEGFAQFFARVIQLTHNYQVFITSAAPPGHDSNLPTPWGCKDAFVWIMDILEKYYIAESLEKMAGEEQQLRAWMETVRKDTNSILERIREIEIMEGKMSQLRQNQSWWRPALKTKLDAYEDSKVKAGEEIELITARYFKDAIPSYSAAKVSMMEQLLAEKERAMAELKRVMDEYRRLNTQRISNSG